MHDNIDKWLFSILNMLPKFTTLIWYFMQVHLVFRNIDKSQQVDQYFVYVTNTLSIYWIYFTSVIYYRFYRSINK